MFNASAPIAAKQIKVNMLGGEDLLRNFNEEKEIYIRENKLEAFKAKIKPIFFGFLVIL